MKIAFDLDDTLILSAPDVEVEIPKIKWVAKSLKLEKLRKGTVEIFKFCKGKGISISIYTTSFRSSFYIRLLFLLHGISLEKVVNQTLHLLRVKNRCSKFPPEFGIDLLVDDSEGVKIEGEKYGFEVIHIKRDNQDWVQEIKQAIETKITIKTI